jgi:hypothetical protein
MIGSWVCVAILALCLAIAYCTWRNLSNDKRKLQEAVRLIDFSANSVKADAEKAAAVAAAAAKPVYVQAAPSPVYATQPSGSPIYATQPSGSPIYATQPSGSPVYGSQPAMYQTGTPQLTQPATYQSQVSGLSTGQTIAPQSTSLYATTTPMSPVAAGTVVN